MLAAVIVPVAVSALPVYVTVTVVAPALLLMVDGETENPLLAVNWIDDFRFVPLTTKVAVVLPPPITSADGLIVIIGVLFDTVRDIVVPSST